MLWRIRGSSPLTRGKPDARRAPPPGHRLIPAHAGKTSRLAGSFWWPGAHPRSRGENVVATLSSKSLTGSSPLTRGKRFGHLVEVLDAGLIPAHAGKTPKASERPGTHRAHPRSRGENSFTPPMIVACKGSSPLTRGKLACFGRADPIPGLIPAHAGKTLVSGSKLSARAAHPRSRGENAETVNSTVSKSGSSPLTRGKRTHRHNHTNTRRLIPAHAGKTRRGPFTPRPRRAHPRSRGEN